MAFDKKKNFSSVTSKKKKKEKKIGAYFIQLPFKLCVQNNRRKFLDPSETTRIFFFHLFFFRMNK